MPKTAVIEGRLDMRDIATCASFFLLRGMPATSRSDLLYKTVATFAEAAKKQGAESFDTTEEALGYLTNLGLGLMNRVKAEGRRANNFTLANTIAQERSMESAMENVTIENNQLEEAMRLFNKEG